MGRPQLRRAGNERAPRLPPAPVRCRGRCRLVVLLSWQAGSDLGWIDPDVLPSPVAVAHAGWQSLRSGELLRTNVEISTWRAAVGFSHRRRYRLLLRPAQRAVGPGRNTDRQLVADDIAMCPHLALIPLVILWFGIGEEAKIFLVSLGVFFPDLRQHATRRTSVDPHLMEMGRAYDMSRATLIWRVVLPGALPHDLCRPALRTWHHLADLDRCRDDRRLVGHRLHGDERPRVHAGRRRGLRDPDLRRTGQARRQRRARVGAGVPRLEFPVYRQQ